MRALLPCSAFLLAVALPATSFAQPATRGYYGYYGGYGSSYGRYGTYGGLPRDAYGNLLAVPGYRYPSARTQDGYETYPSARQPSYFYQAAPVDPMTGYRYDPRYDPRLPRGGADYAPPQHYYERSYGSGYAVSPKFQRQVVSYGGEEKPGTIIIDTPSRFLYLVQDGGKAIRYGIGVGRPGFKWAGRKLVSEKKEWPDWRPPKEMLKRRPDLPEYMEGGPENPLGARALYLGDTLYRIHGTNEPNTIGKAVSSGCIRMLNKDVIDLYNRVPVGAEVLVI